MAKEIKYGSEARAALGAGVHRKSGNPLSGIHFFSQQRADW